MGWKSYSMQEAQEAADNGTAAIGISESRIAVLAAADEDSVEQASKVLTITDSTSAVSVSGLQYYSYSYGAAGGCGSSNSTNRSQFGSVEYKGEIYDIYVPNYVNTTIGTVWKTVDNVQKPIHKIDFAKFIIGLEFEDNDNSIIVGKGDFRGEIEKSVIANSAMQPVLCGASIFAGILNSLNNAINNIFLRCIFQKTSDGRKRVIIKAGSSDVEKIYNSTATGIPISAYYSYAGYPFPQAMISGAVEDLYKKKTGKTPEVLSIYDCEITVDERHTSDNGAESFIWIDKNGRIMETPIIYPKDKVSYGVRRGLGPLSSLESFYDVNLSGSIVAEENYQNIFGYLFGGCI